MRPDARRGFLSGGFEGALKNAAGLPMQEIGAFRTTGSIVDAGAGVACEGPIMGKALQWRFAALLFCSAASMPSQAITHQARAQAAQATASSAAACTALPSFYWEIGDRSGLLASGSRGTSAPKATTQMAIYSAGKWLYGAYVYQQRYGQLSTADVQTLTMSSGYTGDGACTVTGSVGDCQKQMSRYTALAVNRYFYGAGHYQKHAVDMNLGAMNSTQLAAEIRRGLGSGFNLGYLVPQLAGGARSSASDYAIFLRKILNSQLMPQGLGLYPVCTYTGATDAASGRTNCPSALYAPTSDRNMGLLEAWHYSLGHWIEDDPLVGDGAFSSPGAGGFYPWIDASKQYYGVLARVEISATASSNSIKCGRLIRQAWLRGEAPAKSTSLK